MYLPQQPPKENAAQKPLYIGNLNSSVTGEDLIELFESILRNTYTMCIAWSYQLIKQHGLVFII